MSLRGLEVDDDIEGEDRYFDILNNPPPAPTAVLDRGADELVLFPFIRGDANSDLLTNIADVVLLAQLATGAVPLSDGNCNDALDANDDGAFDIADSPETVVVRILARLQQATAAASGA